MKYDEEGWGVPTTDEEIENIEKAKEVLHARHKNFIVQHAFLTYGDNGVHLSGYFTPFWEYENWLAIYYVSFDTWQIERADGGKDVD